MTGASRLNRWGIAKRKVARTSSRPPAIRRWHGPLVGREPEGSEEYLERVARLSADHRTHFYFDASFLMWLAKTGPQARVEFIAWQEKVGGGRFHVPLWAAHEFFKHRLKRTVSTELAREIKAFDSAATGLYEKLRIYCSDQLFGFKNSGRLFLDEYRRTIQPLRAMLEVAKASDQFDTGVQHIATYIDAHLLPGPLGEVVDEIDADERIRNRGVIPPAFKDAHKQGARRPDGAREDQANSGDNSFGDLALWREVLRHASSVRAGAIILLTADRKNDWFQNDHGIDGVAVDIRKRIGKPRPVPAPHPLLVREAFDRGAGALTLLDPMYCGALLERDGGRYADFAAAALDTHLPDPERKKRAVLSWAKRFGGQASLLGELSEPDRDADDEEAFDPSVLTVEQLRRTELAEPASGLISQVEDGDLAARAAAFDSLKVEDLIEWQVPSLVAVGRATLRAAEAEDPSALEFLSHLRDHAPEFPSAVRMPIYFGALGGLFFADDLSPRQPTGSSASVVVLSAVTLPEMDEAVEALAAELSDQTLCYRPGEAGPIRLHVVVQPSANNKSPADLLAIKLGGTDLMTTLQTDEELRFTTLLDLTAGEADITVGALLELITRFHRLPRQLVQVDADLDTPVHVPEYAGIELDT